MTTEAGKRHVEWLLQAKIPTFTGDIYRSNFEAGVLAIEAEAVAAERARITVTALHPAIEAVITRWYHLGLLRFNSRDDGGDDLLLRNEITAAVLAIVNPEADHD